MGHSLGGYFVLYALMHQLTDTSIFHNFIAASPSIYYHNNYLINEIGRSPTNQRDKEKIKLYLTIGQLEILESQSNDFEKLSKTLIAKTINIQTEIYKNLEHMETAIPTFENGIQLFMSR
jgi:predicted alpha/beta superfamily hydrolase